MAKDCLFAFTVKFTSTKVDGVQEQSRPGIDMKIQANWTGCRTCFPALQNRILNARHYYRGV